VKIHTRNGFLWKKVHTKIAISWGKYLDNKLQTVCQNIIIWLYYCIYLYLELFFCLGKGIDVPILKKMLPV
jgi:hypothetical protein